MMKTKLAALASTLALTFMMSTLWGAPTLGDPIESATHSITPIEPGVVDCSATVLDTYEFRDEFTNLQPGTPEEHPLTNQKTFTFPDPIAGPHVVTVGITMGTNNHISFHVADGAMAQINLKAGQAEIFYDYKNINTLVDPNDPNGPTDIIEGVVTSDTGLNRRSFDGVKLSKSQKVSHIDGCLSGPLLPPNTAFFTDCIAPNVCNPSGIQETQLQGGLANQGFENATVTQAPVPALYSAQSLRCGLNPDGTVNNPYIAHDDRVDNDGNLKPGMIGPKDLTTVFNFSGFPDITSGVIAPAEVVGTPCWTALAGRNSVEFVDIFNAMVILEEWTLTVTQLFDSLNSVLLPGPVSTSNPLLQWIKQATLQPDNRLQANYPEQHVGAFTFEVTNPPRTKSGSGTVFLIGTREACVDPNLDIPPNPLTEAYLLAVRDCKQRLAIEYLDNLQLALIEAQNSGAMIEPINFYNTPLNKARNMFDNGNFNKARNDMDQFVDRVVGTSWMVNPQNDPGNLTVRGENLSHRAAELLEFERIHGLK